MPTYANSQSLANILRSLPPNPRVVISGNFASPFSAVKILDETLAEYKLWALNPQKGLPDRPGVVLETPFVGAGMRKSPRLRYVPCRLSLVPRLFADAMPPDALIVHTSTPRDGVVSLGIEVNVLPTAIEACRARGGKVIAQVNPNMPFTYGDAILPLDAIDVVFEADETLAAAPPVVLDDTSRQIGERIAARIKDGSTLQMGIGGVPDAVLNALTNRRGLRSWTEMFSDGMLALDRAGALDANHPLSTSFLFGSHELYQWLDGNQRVRMIRTETTNDPGLIAQQRQMTSVNSALQVDLFSQANASRINARIYSGFGGQTDFIVGALHAVGGQAFMALRSWHPKANVSTVVPLIEEPVTSFQHTAIVTEHGMAEVWGRSQDEQAHNIIENAAHPDVREELREEGAAMGLNVY
ncbi:MAG: acetyl-CoA hydrolase/transferase family protein [Candidatus Nanopelagicales bacterium]